MSNFLDEIAQKAEVQTTTYSELEPVPNGDYTITPMELMLKEAKNGCPYVKLSGRVSADGPHRGRWLSKAWFFPPEDEKRAVQEMGRFKTDVITMGGRIPKKMDQLGVTGISEQVCDGRNVRVKVKYWNQEAGKYNLYIQRLDEKVPNTRPVGTINDDDIPF